MCIECGDRQLLEQFNSMLTEFGKPFVVISDSPMPDLEESAPVKIKAESGMVISLTQQVNNLEQIFCKI